MDCWTQKPGPDEEPRYQPLYVCAPQGQHCSKNNEAYLQSLAPQMAERLLELS